MAKRRKAKQPRPRSLRCWAIMETKRRTIVGVYAGTGYGKNYVRGDCLDDEIPVRVRVIADKN